MQHPSLLHITQSACTVHPPTHPPIHPPPPLPRPHPRPDDRPFSSVVAEARAQGYTEPDPRDDLAGTDVARKVTILARECGLDVDLEQVGWVRGGGGECGLDVHLEQVGGWGG
jgi:hypothetical protein